ncbi:cell division protein FtsQ/DivIB [Solicola gregarius]|uniref:FtsQ-type POTRA domain-containing protein n=1 Tax=Solicola gregarius TaxID=2908642 RepID=A0AA46YKC2_9ACTN|nr:FtsQ-type POTRA domain-containing protein [Solicola gregarius]UYM05352.1 FtsQ-type POTRA domain-containing protein [Solicola gregarius]
MAGPHEGGQRFRRRRWHTRGRRLLPYLIGLGLAALVGVLAWVVFVSPVLGVHDVQVEGAKSVSEENVLRQADIDSGTPLATLDTDAIANRIEELPRVAEVSVQRTWPRGVTVDVRERATVAIVDDDGVLRGVDETGAAYRSYDKRPQGVPLISLDSGVGDDEQTVLAEAARVVGALDDDLADRVRDIEAASIDSIDLVLRNGDRIRWGSAEESERKQAVLEALLDTPASVYDVTVPEHPATSG